MKFRLLAGLEIFWVTNKQSDLKRPSPVSVPVEFEAYAARMVGGVGFLTECCYFFKEKTIANFSRAAAILTIPMSNLALQNDRYIIYHKILKVSEAF